jgi:hypothetical protein
VAVGPAGGDRHRGAAGHKAALRTPIPIKLAADEAELLIAEFNPEIAETAKILRASKKENAKRLRGEISRYIASAPGLGKIRRIAGAGRYAARVHALGVIPPLLIQEKNRAARV